MKTYPLLLLASFSFLLTGGSPLLAQTNTVSPTESKEAAPPAETTAAAPAETAPAAPAETPAAPAELAPAVPAEPAPEKAVEMTQPQAPVEMSNQNTAAVAVAVLAGGMVMMGIWLVVVVLMIAGTWKIFTKAGKPGWTSIIPMYNIYVMCVVAGKPAWWIIMFFIPFAPIAVFLAIAKNFGKGAGFGIGMFFIPVVFFPMLGFGKSSFLGSEGQPTPPAPMSPPSA